VLYGTRWVSVIPLVPMAMAVGAVLACVQAVYSLLLASQQARLCFFADMWRLVGIALGVVFALPRGVTTYLVALFVVHVVAFVFTTYSLVRSGGMKVAGVATALLPAGAAAILAVIAAETARLLALSALPAIPRLAVYISLFATVYVGALRLLFGSLLLDVVTHLPRADRVHRLLGYARA
jgi:hypothetical protein